MELLQRNLLHLRSQKSTEAETTAVASANASANASSAQSTPELMQDAANSTAASGSGWGWHHGVSGETCCMCQVRTGWTTLLYSAEDYSHKWGDHNAMWHCHNECPRKCGSDWHHGSYF